MTVNLGLLVVGGAALVVAVAVVLVLVARAEVRRARELVDDAHGLVEEAQRAARAASGRARAMAEFRVPLEVILQEWGVAPRRALRMAREIHTRVLAEVDADSRTAAAGSMTSLASESIGAQFRAPRDGGPPPGPQGTRVERRA